MNLKDIRRLTDASINSAQDPAVKFGTYAEGKKSSLNTVPDSTENIQKQFYQGKAWPSAEYIIFGIDDKDPISNEECINKWKIFARKLNCTQYLVLEVEKDTWEMFNGYGEKMGDEIFINEYFSSLKDSLLQSTQAVYQPILKILHDKRFYLSVGDISESGNTQIVAEDAFCYRVLSKNHGAKGIRTISKDILAEWINYKEKNPTATANTTRESLKNLSDNDAFEYGYSATFHTLSKMHLINKKKCHSEIIGTNEFPLQLIYFGAPGTSKSTRIKRETEDKGKEVHRVTFHPDTDYSNFVGCYKPTTIKQNVEETVYSKYELINFLKQMKDEGISYPYHKFACKYWKSVKSLSTADKKEILSKTGSSENYTVEFDKAAVLGEEYSNTSSSITYKFVAQTFTHAYVSAWKKLVDANDNNKDVFLVIEEINRGNCAQIFGDLFQLLDRREDGYSDYSIEPDSDLQDYLRSAFVNCENIPAEIKSGKKMQLPPNFYIWATMNTSDQSLFPIDSAFKRRWDWRYTPITKPADKNHKIRIEKTDYDLWEFLENVNERIEALTESEDKQLGYWFARPKTGEVIDVDTFVGKVVFYLWNDIFKDFGEDERSPFMVKKVDDKERKEKITFRKFFNKVTGKIDNDIVMRFIESLGLKGTEVKEEMSEKKQAKETSSDTDNAIDDQNVELTAPSGNKAGYLKITFEDGREFNGINNSSDAFMEALQYFVDYGFSIEEMIKLNIIIGGQNMINAAKIGNRSERAIGDYWVQTKQPITMKKSEIEKISEAAGIKVVAEIVKDNAVSSETNVDTAELANDEEPVIFPKVLAAPVENISLPIQEAEEAEEVLF